MNFRQMSNEQIALILTGLRTIYVHDHEKLRLKMIADCEAALASRGLKLNEAA